MIYHNSKRVDVLYRNGKNIERVMHKGKCVFNGCAEATAVSTVPMAINTTDTKISQYQIWGNIQQNGIPTPESPVEVLTVGEYDEATGKYKVPVEVRGKNLLNPANMQTGAINFTLGIPLNINTDYPASRCFIFDVEPNIEYTFSLTNTIDTAVYRIVEVDGNNTKINIPLGQDTVSGVNTVVTGTFTTTSNTKKLCVQTRIENIDTTQLELGSEATGYEPYREPTTTSIYLSKPLCQGDYIFKDKAGGKVYRKYGVVDLGTLGWRYSPNKYFATAQIIPPEENLFVSHYKNVGYVKDTDIESYGDYTISIAYNKSFLRIVDSRFSDVETFKNAVSGVMLYYPLATPIEETIELPDIPTIKGENIIDVNTTIKPERISLIYKTRGNK